MIVKRVEIACKWNQTGVIKIYISRIEKIWIEWFSMKIKILIKLNKEKLKNLYLYHVCTMVFDKI